MKRILSLLLTILLIIGMLSSCSGEPGPQGEKGDKGDVGPQGDKGDKGDKGDTGDGVAVTSISKTATDGLVDTYTVVFSDGTQTTFTVTNGAKGEKGDTVSVTSCQATATVGLTTTYKITFSNGDTATFNVKNGAAGASLSVVSCVLKESSAYGNTYEIKFSDNEVIEITAPAGAKGEKGDAITVTSCKITASVDNVDTYTVTFSDGSTASFNVNNAVETVSFKKATYNADKGEYKIEYTDGTFFAFTLPSEAEILAEYKFLSNFAGVADKGKPFPGYSGSEDDFVLSVINEAFDKLISGGSALNAKALGTVMPVMLADYNTYFETVTTKVSERKVDVVIPAESIGYYMSGQGVPKTNVNYCYTAQLEVSAGDVVTFHKTNGDLQAVSFVTAYTAPDTANGDLSCNDDGDKKENPNKVNLRRNPTSYTVPDGVVGLVCSFTKATDMKYYTITRYSVDVALKDNVTAVTVNCLLNGLAGRVMYGNTVVSLDGYCTVYYSDGTKYSFDAAAITDLKSAFNTAASKGYTGSFSDFVTLSVNKAAAALLSSGGTSLDAKAFGSALPTIFDNYDKYFTIDLIDSEYTDVAVVENVGFLRENNTFGQNSASQSYRYTNMISVSEGQKVEILSGSRTLGFRFVTAFKDGVHVADKSLNGDMILPTYYVVPSGVNGVVLTYTASSEGVIARISDNSVEVNVNPSLTVAEINTLVGGSGGSVIVIESKNESIVATTDKLTAGSYIKLENNHIMLGKTLTFSFDIASFGDNDVIRVGHGETSYGGNYIELTKTQVKIYSYVSSPKLEKTYDHGLTLSGYVNIVIDNSTSNTRGSVTVSSSGGMFQKINDFTWQGRNGEIFAVSTASDITNVKMRWSCVAYDSDVWLLGDSYFNGGSDARWTSYLLKAGYTDVLLSGYPGRNSASGLTDFKQMLKHGKPKYAIWCLGMNNGDSATDINSSYLSSVTEFIDLCEENGIIPILSTIPCTPGVNNSHKNAWVKSSGYRYIDFARAVGGEAVGSSWYPGMIESGDQKVHPSVSGAKALYAQFLVDFPEIATCWVK